MQIGGVLGGALGALGAWVECAREAVTEVASRLAPLLPGRWPAPDSRRAAGAGRRVAAEAAQAAVEQAKYYVGPAGAEGRTRAGEPAVDHEPGEPPRAYGRDRLVLLPRDPWWVFAYWEVTPTGRIEAIRRLGAEAEGAKEILRVHDVTFITFTGANAWTSFDAELPPGAESWHLNVPRAGASYCAEIGLRTPAGRFLPLVRSNTVTTPRPSPSTDATVRWVELGRDRAPRAATAAWRAPLEAVTPPLEALGSSDAHAPWPGR